MDITLIEYDYANLVDDELPVAALLGSEEEGLGPTGRTDVNHRRRSHKA